MAQTCPLFPSTVSFLQATSDKTASANFTQTPGSVNARGIANNLTNKTNGYAPYYQWGRKDAFRSNEYTNIPAEGTTLVYKQEAVTVGTTIQNPTIHYNSGGSSGNAYDPICYNAWNATYTELKEASTDNIEVLNTTKKTIYDPCPIGYTVAPANTFIAFDTTNFPVKGNGRQYTSNGKKLYFPLAGRRYFASAELYSPGTLGDYWQSVCGKATSGRFMLFDENNVTPVAITGSGYARGSGHPIRPISENVRQH